MASYNFLQETSLHIVFNSKKYKLNVSTVNFSQTFTEDSRSVRTLHAPKNVFEASTITKANPADFEFSLNLLREDDYEIVMYLLTKYSSSDTDNINSFDLYISTELDLFKIETCVITNGQFVINRSRPLSLSVSGQGAKLTHVGTVASNTIPGTEVARSSTSTAILPSECTIRIGGSAVSDIVGVSIELQNDVQWNPYQTVNSAVAVTNASNSIYPSGYTLEKRILSGSIQRYITDSNSSDLQTWSTNSEIYIKAGSTIGNLFAGLEFNLTTCSFTNRLEAADIFLQNYDWRYLENPADLEVDVRYLPHYPININN